MERDLQIGVEPLRHAGMPTCSRALMEFDEDHSRFLQLQWPLQDVEVQSDREAVAAVRLPMALSRCAIRSAQQLVHPALILVQPVTGFQVMSVHSMDDRMTMSQPWASGCLRSRVSFSSVQRRPKL